MQSSGNRFEHRLRHRRWACAPVCRPRNGLFTGTASPEVSISYHLRKFGPGRSGRAFEAADESAGRALQVAWFPVVRHHCGVSCESTWNRRSTLTASQMPKRPPLSCASPAGTSACSTASSFRSIASCASTNSRPSPKMSSRPLPRPCSSDTPHSDQETAPNTDQSHTPRFLVLPVIRIRIDNPTLAW